MRKFALLASAALLALALPTKASADNGSRFVGDMLHQIVVPFDSLAGTAQKAPAKKAKKAKKGMKKAAKKSKKAKKKS